MVPEGVARDPRPEVTSTPPPRALPLEEVREALPAVKDTPPPLEKVEAAPLPLPLPLPLPPEMATLPPPPLFPEAEGEEVEEPATRAIPPPTPPPPMALPPASVTPPTTPEALEPVDKLRAPEAPPLPKADPVVTTTGPDDTEVPLEGEEGASEDASMRVPVEEEEEEVLLKDAPVRMVTLPPIPPPSLAPPVRVKGAPSTPGRGGKSPVMGLG